MKLFIPVFNFIPGTGKGEIQTYGANTLGVGGFKFSDCLNGFEPGKWTGTATLVNGTATVTLSPQLTALFTATTVPEIWIKTLLGAPGIISITNQTTSGFTITSTSSGDASIIGWKVISDLHRKEMVIPNSMI